MLGHVVARFFRQVGYTVRTSEARYDGTPQAPLLRAVLASDCSVVINCARARNEGDASAELMVVNALLPLHIAATLRADVLFVHASSDAVFDGSRSWRQVDEPPDAHHGYGLAKRLSEGCITRAKTVVLRTSVVGPEAGQPRSLLSRLIAHEHDVPGYVDHRWNGITSLEWARLARLAANGGLAPGLHHPVCQHPVTKFELVSAIAQVYGRPARVDPVASGHPVDHTLKPTLLLAPIHDQLIELQAWYDTTT